MENQEKSELLTEETQELFDLSDQVNANPARDFWEFVVDLAKTGVIVFILAFLLRYFVIQPYIVDGESMMPTYQNHEYLLAEKISYLRGEPERGDVVIFRYPKNPSLNYIKRIIALPGERIKIADNKVTIYNEKNPAGSVPDENYLPSTTKTETFETSSLDKTLGEGEYFVMGDNREHSSDSREWGVLPRENILGRSWLTLVPFNRAAIHRRITYPEVAKLMTQPIAMLKANLHL